MIPVIRRCLCLALCAFLTFAPTTVRADEFAPATLGNLIKGLIRFGALTIKDDTVINDYAIINECKLYDYFVHDDFRWHDVQEAIRKSIRQNVAVFPTNFQYDATMRLDKYDFKAKLFRFLMRQGKQTVNSFTLSGRNDGKCGDVLPSIMGTNFNFVLDHSIQLPGIPLDEGESKALLKRMDAAGNSLRVVYARFNLRVVYVAPLLPPVNNNGGVVSHSYRQQSNDPNIRIDSRLDSIDFFEDEEHTKLIIRYRP